MENKRLWYHMCVRRDWWTGMRSLRGSAVETPLPDPHLVDITPVHGDRDADPAQRRLLSDASRVYTEQHAVYAWSPVGNIAVC